MAPWTYLLISLGFCFLYGYVKGNFTTDQACYMKLCYCSDKTADCSDNGKGLTFLPKVQWKNIENYFFRRNYLPNITLKTFDHIKIFNIMHLKLEGNQIYLISKKAFRKLPTLRTLHLSDNFMDPKSLQEAFDNFPPSLAYLYLNNVSLSNLPGDFFNGLYKISVQGIHMEHNNLTNFNQNVTYGLKSLTTLSLRFNQISTLELNLSRTLGVLLLGHNQLGSIPDLCPNGSALYPELWTLGLEFNNITDLNSSNYRCITNLKYSYLSGNRFRVIHSNSFSNLPNLYMVRMDQNMGPLSLQNHAFQNNNLKSLNLSMSHLKFFAYSTFSDCPSLQILDLSNRTFRYPDQLSRMLSNNSLLTSFWCKNCGLTKIPYVFKKMAYLTFLFLDGNSIEVIPEHVFDDNTRLSHLSLSHNNIKTVTGFAISYSLRYKLKYISLEFNPFNCDCQLLWLKDWIHKDKDMFWGQYMNYKCASPPNYKGQQILDVGAVSDKVCLLEHSQFTSVFCAAATVFIVIVVVSLLYKWRWKIRYCFLKRRDPRPAFSGETRPLLYNDAYVVYCDENYHPWIRSELMPNIEEQRSQKLGIRQRDFDQTRHKVSNIVDNLRKCRKVIVVLSNSFFRDSESRDELSLVLKCVGDLIRGVLIVIILEDIDDRYMSNPLYRLLQKADLIRWPADSHQRDMFWTSLILCLEDSTLHSFS